MKGAPRLMIYECENCRIELREFNLSIASIRKLVNLFLLVMIKVLFEFARLESFRSRSGLRRPGLDDLLEQHVHEHEHRLGPHHDGAGGVGPARGEMPVPAVVAAAGDRARFPGLAEAGANLVAFAGGGGE